METLLSESFDFNPLIKFLDSGENNFCLDFTHNNFFDLKDDSLIKDRTYKCPNCLQYPIIHYCDNIDIEVTCSCYNKKRMTIEEFLNPFIDNLLSFSLDRKESFYEKINQIYNKLTNKCIFHQKKFKYYCNDCELNICEDCFENHNFHNIHNFENYITDNKIIIKIVNKKINEKLYKFFYESVSSIMSYESEEEEEKQSLNKDKYIKLFKVDNNNLIKISESKLKHFYILSNLIIDEALNNPNIIHCYNIQNLLEFLKKNEENFEIKINLIDKNKIIDPNIENYYKESQDKLFDEILSKF